MSKPNDIELYNIVKQIANKVFKTNKGLYRSMYIQKLYKSLNGTYDKPKPKNTKSSIWLREKWVDLNNPIYKNNKIIGYRKCGSKNTQNNLYPLCRPSIKVNKHTPILYQSISKKRINMVNKKKQTLKNKGNIKWYN